MIRRPPTPPPPPPARKSPRFSCFLLIHKKSKKWLAEKLASPASHKEKPYHSQTIHFLCLSKFLQQLPIKVDLSTCEGEGFLDIGCCFFSCCCSRVSGCRGGYRDIIKVSPTMVDNASKYSSNLLVGNTKTVSCRSNFLQYVSRNGNRSDPGETSYKFGTS